MSFSLILEYGLPAVFFGYCSYDLWKMMTAKDERAEETEKILRQKYEARERMLARREAYVREGEILKQRVLDELRSIKRGEKTKFDQMALDAVISMQKRDGDHPDNIAAWAPVIEKLKRDAFDAKEIHTQINDLLYPDTLENIDELKLLLRKGIEEISTGHDIDPETIDAGQSLKAIWQRDKRKLDEEIDENARKRREELEKDKLIKQQNEEVNRQFNRVTAKQFELPTNIFDKMSITEAHINIKAIRELHLMTGASLVECARVFLEWHLEDQSKNVVANRDNSMEPK